MKILIFSPYYPPHTGGLESHADEFNKHLSQKGTDITVFTPHLPVSAPKKEIRYNNVEIIRFPAFEVISNYPLPKFWKIEFWRLFLSLFSKKFDIILSRTRFFNTSILALIYAKIKNIRWIHIEHGSDFVKSGGKISVVIAKIYDHTFGKLVFFLADKIIANSKASAEFCKKIVPKINCEVIYRGVETEKIELVQPDLKLRNKYEKDILITFVGRLIDGKGIANLINATKDIAGDFKIFIIGDGPQREDLEKLTKKLGLEEKIIFFGYKKFEEVIGILKISDIFVNPSYTEGLPTSVVEAALCKKAIIATIVGGTSEIITNNKSGFLIEPENTNALKEKLETLITNENLRQEFGNNAFTESQSKFNWSKSIKKYLEILEKNA